MRHGRAEYEQIQDPHGIIGEDEPVFLMRAKDLSAPAVVELWATLAEQNGAPDRAAAARAQADAMRIWQETPGNPTQYPADKAPRDGEGHRWEWAGVGTVSFSTSRAGGEILDWRDAVSGKFSGDDC